MMRRLSEVPEPITHPSQIAPGERWSRQCRHCPAEIQQGRSGMRAHLLTAHPDKAERPPLGVA